QATAAPKCHTGATHRGDGPGGSSAFHGPAAGRGHRGSSRRDALGKIELGADLEPVSGAATVLTTGQPSVVGFLLSVFRIAIVSSPLTERRAFPVRRSVPFCAACWWPAPCGEART